MELKSNLYRYQAAQEMKKATEHTLTMLLVGGHTPSSVGAARPHKRGYESSSSIFVAIVPGHAKLVTRSLTSSGHILNIPRAKSCTH